MNSPISDLKTKGFVTLEYPPELRKAVQVAIGAWQGFFQLPIDDKAVLPYSNQAAGVGYEVKVGNGPKADRKENFDLTIAGKSWLESNLVHFENPAALNFVNRALGLIPVMKPLILDFARQAESTFGLAGFADEVAVSENAYFVRFIHYFGGRQMGDEMATAHADQSGFTLHLFESDPGLECLSLSDKKWIDMPVSEGETVIIPAMQLQLRSQGKLTALAHRVTARPETVKKGRFSAVCFIQLKNTSQYDKARHGRLQEKEPGFNYGMTHGEFAKLFK